MEYTQKHPTIAASAIAAVIVLLVVVIAAATKQRENTLTATTFSSRYSTGTDSVAPNYRGETNTNSDAARQNFVIFNQANLALPTSIRTNLATTLGYALAKEIAPSQGVTFIQIVPSTIKCPNIYDCAFSFYLDSPESYFSYHSFYQSDGTQSYTLTQQPLPGGTV